MQTDEIIPVNEFCVHYQVELSFINSLNDTGLIEVTTVGEELCVPMNQLPQLERMVRLYYEMDINMEGIETITHLLNQMKEMQEKITRLQNRLQLYEEI